MVVAIWSQTATAQNDADFGNIQEFINELGRLPNASMADVQDISNAINISKFNFVETFLGANGHAEVEEMMDSLIRDNDPMIHERYLRFLEKNQVSYVRFLMNLQAQTEKDPKALDLVRSRLDRLDKVMKKRGISLHKPARCMFGLTFLIAVRGFTWDLKTWSENMRDRHRHMDEIQDWLTAGAGLVVLGATCLADIVAIKRDVVSTYENLKLDLKGTGKKAVHELAALVRSSEKHQAVIQAAKGVVYFGRHQEAPFPEVMAALAAGAYQGIEIPHQSAILDLWRTYSRAGRIQQIIDQYMRSLSPIEIDRFQRALFERGVGSLTLIPVQAQIIEFQQKMLVDFVSWVQESHSNQIDDLNREAETIRASMEVARKKALLPSIPASMCFSSAGALLALGGWRARLGDQPRANEAGIEGFLRGKFEPILLIGSLAFVGSCFTSVVETVKDFRVRLKGEHERVMTNQEWQVIRKTIQMVRDRGDIAGELTASMKSDSKPGRTPDQVIRDAMRMIDLMRRANRKPSNINVLNPISDQPGLCDRLWFYK